MTPKCTGWHNARGIFDLADVGDLVKFDRALYKVKYNVSEMILYGNNMRFQHWAIVVSKNETDRSVSIIHYADSGTGNIREDILQDVANGGTCAIDNSLDNHCKPHPPRDIVERARSRVSIPENTK